MPTRKRIIFVDDEPQILNGLKRRLSGLACEWDMIFVSSSASALEELSKANFDVIVSDMRMPDMDGAALLEQVRQHYPHMARIALSGHSEQELVMRALGPTHQYLSKPCNPELLKSTIKRACSLREVLSIPKLREIITGMTCLPSLPCSYRELTVELQSANSSLKRVAAIVSRDMSMTAKLLQLANSEYFGLSQTISCAEDAVNYLGLEVIRSLILTVNLFAELKAERADNNLFEELWAHSLMVAVCARQIVNAEQMGADMADQAFTAGLLHDIGGLVLALNLPEQRKSALELASKENIPIWQAERMILNTSHMEVGAYLLSLWGLPDPIVEAVAFHHEPSRCTELSFLPLTAVHAAECLQKTMQSHDLVEPGASQVDVTYLEFLGMTGRWPNWQILCEVTLEEGLSEELRNLIAH
jgi:putative nucleotidyltransferase with HDIG domain